MKNSSYAENPEYFKRLISKINLEVNFPAYLAENGYALIKKSLGSMEFKNEADRIVLNLSRNPVTYFNRNDSTDKGLFFKFIRKQNQNFYQTIKMGLEIIDRSYELQDNSSLKIIEEAKKQRPIEENYNIVPLRNMDYLTQNRAISIDTLNSTPFKGRIYNAYHIRDNRGKIGNIAFPKYDLQGNIKNYILYNKPYKSKVDHTYKKFKMVLNKKDHFLFYSNPNIDAPKKIVFGENGIDLLSYHELHGNEKNLYVSFGGNVYAEKLESFVQFTSQFTADQEIEFVSIMDNDRAGHEYDIKIFSALINHWNTNVYLETGFKGDKITIRVHYTEGVQDELSLDKTRIENHLKTSIGFDGFDSRLVRMAAFADKLVFEFSLKELTNTFDIRDKGQNALQVLLGKINSLYLPFDAVIHDSVGKDWNEDLKASKRSKYIKLGQVDAGIVRIGDKIELKTAKGPEGSKNQGIVREIKKNGFLCDFGLKYSYAIPFSAIRSHYKKVGNVEKGEDRKRNKKQDKTQSIEY